MVKTCNQGRSQAAFSCCWQAASIASCCWQAAPINSEIYEKIEVQFYWFILTATTSSENLIFQNQHEKHCKYFTVVIYFV
jgi:hypothetical protein